MKKFLLSALAFFLFSPLAFAISPAQNETIVLSKKHNLPPPPPPPGQIIPAERNFAWNPGMMSKGGIPNRTTICATLSPSGGDDTSAIQTAINACPAGQVVFLNSGTFQVNGFNYILLSKGITLRGNGKGNTILYKHGGANPRFNTVVSGTNGILAPESPYISLTFTGSISGSTLTVPSISCSVNIQANLCLNVGDALTCDTANPSCGILANTTITAQNSGPVGGAGTYTVSPGGQSVPSSTINMNYAPAQAAVLQVGPTAFPAPDNTTSQNLTVDGAQGANSVTIASGTGFAAGQFVVLDEDPFHHSSWQAVPTNYGCANNKTNAQFTATISGTTMTVSALTGSFPTPNLWGVIYQNDYLYTGIPNWSSNPNSIARIVSQSSGTTGGAGVYVTNTPITQSTPVTFSSSGPCPPMVWAGDHVTFAAHWPSQVFVDDVANSNSSGPFDATPGDLPNLLSVYARLGRVTNEIKEVASVSGNVITFTSPLAISYRVAKQAQLTRYTNTSIVNPNSVQVTMAGVENLSVLGGANGGIIINSCAYCWAKNIEVTRWLGEGIAIANSFRIEVRDSYFHQGSWPEPGGGGYAISSSFMGTELLYENNIFVDSNKNMVFRASGTGSVVAYNYADDPWIATNTIWQEVSLNGSHFAGPHHILFEGNYGVNFDSDFTHGNAIDMTIFRNQLAGLRRDFTDTQNVRAGGLAAYSTGDSFVGNILGKSGAMSGWSLTAPAMTCDSNGANCTNTGNSWPGLDIWELGYDPTHYSMNPEPSVYATVIRDGNYDFLTNSQRWHNTPGGFAIPNSLYLTSKPAFFGSNPWPWVDPITGAIYTLPAKARYDAGTP